MGRSKLESPVGQLLVVALQNSVADTILFVNKEV